MTIQLATMAAMTAISPEMLTKVRQLEAAARKGEQVEIKMEHVLHGGMYARTARVPGGVLFVGSLIKCPTVLIVSGRARMLLNDGFAELHGYNVIPGSAGRKQVFVTRSPVELTMIFPSTAETVEQAEAEFSDESDLLLSRRQNNETILITGE